MTTTRATICNKKGLHARAAAKLVNLAASFKTPLTVSRLDRNGAPAATAGGTSILSLLMLAADMGSTVEITGEGADGEAAVAAVVDLISRRFEEPE